MALKVVEVTVLATYVVMMSAISVYCFNQLYLLVVYLKTASKRKQFERNPPQLHEYPVVTVQLPVFNEYHVVERLIDAVTALDWPKDRLEIQVLDDSTDDTFELSKKKVAAYRKAGFDIKLIHRTDRRGYKAGALQNGLAQARGQFICIFDADFLPHPDFLLKTMPYFNDSRVGLVQTHWDHLNRDYSLLTRLQAFALDAHFSIEQAGRFWANTFLNFNGTAGVWRKSCILDAGGWHADTLTEDLDLSYRAQMKGWRVIYLESVRTPAEVPVTMNAIRLQQYRWNKGGAQVAKKLIPALLRADLPLRIKLTGIIHLLNTSIYPVVFLTALISIVFLVLKPMSSYPVVYQYASIFLLSFIIISAVYLTAALVHAKTKTEGLKQFILYYPLFVAFILGLSFHNARAVMSGWLGKQSGFLRTPKFNIKSTGDNWMNNRYFVRKKSLAGIAEFLLSMGYLVAIIKAFNIDDYGLLPFHLAAFIGYAAIFYFSAKHAFVIQTH